jgi:signal transduction histidine kinase
MTTARVLIVEDEVVVANNLHDRLRELGYSVLGMVASGEEAVRCAGETLPDLVLMDIKLRGEIDGVQAAEQIRAGFGIPVVYLTGFADDTTLQRAKVAEPYGYVLKPFELRELRTAIEVALYKHAMEKKLQESEQRYREQLEQRVAERTADLVKANRQLQQEIAEREQVEAQRIAMLQVLEKEMIVRIEVEQRLERLAQQAVSAQEEERRRVSRELHDEAGQALTALKISLELARSDLPDGSDLLYQRVGEAIALTDATIEQIRLLAQGLRPPALDTVGLNAAQESFCRDFAQRTQLSVDYVGVELRSLPDAVGISLYRFLQEALTNVAKHADARHIRVELRQDAEAISLLVEDDGRGFDPEAVLHLQPAGIGLLGMQERLKLLGGWLEITSRPGQGACLIAYVPRSELE